MADEIIKDSEVKESEEVKSKHFIEQIIDKDLAEGKYTKIVTRFPPEPNGYLHIGHAKSILLNYGMAVEYGGQFNLRFDDTNPAKEDKEFVEGIIEDLAWLGYKPTNVFYGSGQHHKPLGGTNVAQQPRHNDSA